MGEHPGIGQHRTGGVSPLNLPLDAPIQHRQVPTRSLVRRQASGHARRTLTRSVGAVAQGVDMAAPEHHARVGPYCADGRLGAFGGGISAPLGKRTHQGKVLPDQHPSLVGRVVQGRWGDMAVQPNQIEPRFLGQLHVTAQTVVVHLGPPRGGGTEAGALQEHPDAVDRELPPVHFHGSQSGAHPPSVAQPPLGGARFHGDVVERLIPEPVGPPSAGFRHGHSPLHVVESRGQHMIVGVLHLAHGRMESHEARSRSIQVCLQGHHCSSLGGAEGAHSQIQDPDLASAFHPDRRPQPTRVARRQQLRCLPQRTQHVAPGNVGRAGRTRNLQSQQVLTLTAHGLGHVELVGHEVALHIAQIAPVQPHIGLIQHPSKHQPPPLPRRRRLLVEPMPIPHRSLVAQLWNPPPMSRHRNRNPASIIKPQIGKPQKCPTPRSRHPFPS